jgi:hypothetical protein
METGKKHQVTEHTVLLPARKISNEVVAISRADLSSTVNVTLRKIQILSKKEKVARSVPKMSV